MYIRIGWLSFRPQLYRVGAAAANAGAQTGPFGPALEAKVAGFGQIEAVVEPRVVRERKRDDELAGAVEHLKKR